MDNRTFDGWGLSIAETEEGDPALEVTRECHLCGSEDGVEMQHEDSPHALGGKYRFGCVECERTGEWDAIALHAFFSWRRQVDESE